MPWTEHEQIVELYAKAKELRTTTEEDYQVDHIVPLTPPLVQSLEGNTIPRTEFVGPLIPIVQGLHVYANLQIIAGIDNRRKANRSWPDMPAIQI